MYDIGQFAVRYRTVLHSYISIGAAPTVLPTGAAIHGPEQACRGYILISNHTIPGNHASAVVRATGTVSNNLEWMLKPDKFR